MIRVVFRLFRQGMRDLAINPWAQVFTLAAVTLVAFLSGLFLIALITLNHQLGTTRGETAFQVYWNPGVDMLAVQEQWSQVKHMPGYSSIKVYSPQEALKELGTRLGYTGAATPDKAFPFLAATNPLPATALIFFTPREADIESWISQTADYLKNMPGVERVVVTPLRDELGQAWRKMSRYVMWPSISFLGLVLGLVVGNTVRLSLLARAHEIEILQLVGARNWYIRFPLIVSGATLGFLGGLMALVLLRFIHIQVYDVLNFPPLLMEIRFLPWELALALVFVPALMGSVASWLAVRG